jgi:dihydroneopterin triphosphate diphosphatase
VLCVLKPNYTENTESRREDDIDFLSHLHFNLNLNLNFKLFPNNYYLYPNNITYLMKIVTNYIEAHIFRLSERHLEFLLLKRAGTENYPGLWQMVSGKIKDGEKAYDTVLREIKEETNLTPQKLWTAPNVNQFYTAEDDSICLMPVFAALVDEKAKVKISQEHSDFTWIIPGEAKKMLAWEGQRKSVDIISNYFLREESFLNLVEIKI